MKYIVTKIALLGLSIYAVLCIQGIAIAPKDIWGIAAIVVPIFFILRLEYFEYIWEK